MRKRLSVIIPIALALFILTVMSFKSETQRVESSARGVTFYEREIPPVDGGGASFLMMETEVTQALYEAVMGVNPSSFDDLTDSPQRPVEEVNWEDGIVFANALSTAMGLQPAYDGDDNNAVLIEGANGFRYPLEAEWEWAARCGESYRYAGSDNLDTVAWCWDRENPDAQTRPVGQKQANACGLKDMSGNVQEWMADDWSNPGQHRPGAAERVGRGGGWGDIADGCRVSFRFNRSPGDSNRGLGLRLIRPLN